MCAVLTSSDASQVFLHSNHGTGEVVWASPRTLFYPFFFRRYPRDGSD